MAELWSTRRKPYLCLDYEEGSAYSKLHLDAILLILHFLDTNLTQYHITVYAGESSRLVSIDIISIPGSNSETQVEKTIWILVFVLEKFDLYLETPLPLF